MFKVHGFLLFLPDFVSVQSFPFLFPPSSPAARAETVLCALRGEPGHCSCCRAGGDNRSSQKYGTEVRGQRLCITALKSLGATLLKSKARWSRRTAVTDIARSDRLREPHAFCCGHHPVTVSPAGRASLTVLFISRPRDHHPHAAPLHQTHTSASLCPCTATPPRQPPPPGLPAGCR